VDKAQLTERAQELAVMFAPRILAAIAIFVIGRWVAKAFANVARKAMRRVGADPILENFLYNIFYTVSLIVVVIAALGQVGVQTTSFIAMLGAAGLAIGLALQGSLSNFAAGVLIVILRPYRTGDFVEAGGVSGTVTEVQIFSTVLTTPDNKRIIIPNSQINSGVITNFSANATRRLDLVFGASYDDNIGTIKDLLTSIVNENKLILNDPESRIVVSELASSSVNFTVMVWVNRADYLNLKFELIESVKRRFDDAGLSIPYPQIDSHVHQVEPPKAA